MPSPLPLCIAGGGLAGLALGIALRRQDVPVQLLEAGAYPRHRVCGEFISGVQDDELCALGIDDLLADAPRHHTTAWLTEDAELLRTDLPHPARGISRHRLDLRLANRFTQLGGDLQTGTRFPHTNGQPGLVRAIGRPRRESAWLGLKAHYLDLPLTAHLEIHLSDSAYIGITPVEDGRVNVCGLFRRRTPLSTTDRHQLLPTAARHAGLHQLADRLAATPLDPASVKGVNQFLLGWQPRPLPDDLRLGDTAAMIPPFTGNGMSMALQSALDAVGPLAAWSRGQIPWRHAVQTVRHAHHQRFARRLRWSWALHSLLLHPTPRTLALTLLQKGWLPFNRLYQAVR